MINYNNQKIEDIIINIRGKKVNINIRELITVLPSNILEDRVHALNIN